MPRRDATPVLTLGLIAMAGLCPALIQPAAAEPLTRADVVRLAMAQNPQVAAARARESGARARASQVDAAGYPEVSVTFGVGPSLKAKRVPGSAVASTEDSFSDLSLGDVSVVVGSQLEVTQPIYTFGKIGLRDAATKHDLRARQAQTRMTRIEVALEAVRLFEGLLFARDAVLFFEDVEHQLSDTIESTRERVEDGEDVGESELMQIQSAVSFARLQLNRARASVRQAEGGLRAYLGMASDAAITPAPVSLEAIATPPGELGAHTQEAGVKRPELQALSEGALALRALADAREADGLPDIFALAFVHAAYTPGRDWIDTRYAVDPMQHFVPGLLVGMRWRWQAGRADAQASEQRAEAAELEGLQQWARAGIPAEVRKAYEDAMRARLDITEAAKGLKTAKRWVVVSTADYTVGLANSQDVVNAFEAYAGLRVSHMDAHYRYNVAMAELAAATGTLDTEGIGPYPGPAQSGGTNGKPTSAH